MKLIHPYLNFPGTCEEAFNFYKSIFGGEYSYFSRFSDMPPQEGRPALTETQKKMVLHVSLPISKEIVLMASDNGGDWGPPFIAGNNMSLSITVDSKELADTYFNGLSAGGKVTMPMAKMFWGDYFGMFTDKFNINWMVSYNEQFKFPQ